jgi:hypothetical protein
MTFEEAVERLVEMARKHGGALTAEQVESDDELSAERDLVSAAARSLDGETNVFGTSRSAEDGWFPFKELRFT